LIMILQALLLFSTVQVAFAEHVPCPNTYRLSIEEVGCTSGLMVSTASSECLSISLCDDSQEKLALGAEHWEQSYRDVFLCCPENLDDILQSPQTEEECTTKCKLESGMASVATWVDGTCSCSLSAFGQCDPFGEMAQGYSTCQRYFNAFGDNNCNYNLKSHQLCANEDFDYDGDFIQIRDLCPDQCATVAFVEDSLDETVSFDLETGEALKMSNDRRRLSGYRTHLLGKPYGAIVYEHKNGGGTAWRLKTRRCCSKDWPWSSKCSGRCRTSGHRNLKKSNNKISSVSVMSGCELTLWQHGSWPHNWFGRVSYYGSGNRNAYHDNDASSFEIKCWW